MMKQLLLTLYICLGGMILFAQENAGTIKGTVKDEKTAPLEFVNVFLKKAADSALVKAAVTNPSGEFVFENIDTANYFLVFDQLGFSNLSSEKFNSSVKNNFSDIVLKEESKNLKEVEVTYKRPLIEHEPGKTIVNVDNSLVSGGGTVLDVLKKSPGVIVDKDGNISLKGKQGVLILIDGKPTYLSGEQLANLLKSMPADQVDQIELMTIPPAKYDAEGNAGIINIKLKKTKLLGFNGSIRTGYSQGIYAKTGNGLNMNYRNEKVNVFFNGNFAASNNFTHLDITRKFRQNGIVTYDFDQFSDLKQKEMTGYTKTGMDIFLKKNHTLGFVATGMLNPSSDKIFNYTEIKNGTELLQSGTNTNSNSVGKDKNISLNLNYKWDIDTVGGTLTADVDYAKFDFSSDQHIKTDYFDSTKALTGISDILRSIVPNKVDIKSFKTDLTKTIFKKTKLEAGAKSSIVNTDNDVKYYNTIGGVESIDTSKSNHFKYTENINAIYLDLSREFGKLSIQAGLRGEQTIAKGTQYSNDSTFTRNYRQLFPTFFASYKLNSKNQLDLSYSRRIDRPDYHSLNPFKYYLDPYTYQQGNPFLKPQFTNDAELTYTFMDALSATVNFSQTKDIMLTVTKQNDITKVSYATEENLDLMNTYGVDITLPIPITKWLTSINDLNYFYSEYKGNFLGAQVNNGANTFTFNSENDFELKKGWSVNIWGSYHSAIPYGIFVALPEYAISAGFQKKILKDRGKILVNVQNILFNYQTSSVKYQNMDIKLTERHDTRFGTISFSYNFGKTTVKRSRQHSSGAQDELNRAGKGK